MSWFKNNLVGLSVCDNDLQVVSHPTLELTTHVTTKTVQSFGLLGTLLVGPINAAVRSDTRNWPAVKQKMTAAGQGGVILGLVAGPLMTYMSIRNEEGIKVWDRCYRLRCNKGQVRVDRWSILGAACGAGVGVYTSSGAVFGSLVGMSSGILFAAVCNNCF